MEAGRASSSVQSDLFTKIYCVDTVQRPLNARCLALSRPSHRSLGGTGAFFLGEGGYRSKEGEATLGPVRARRSPARVGGRSVESLGAVVSPGFRSIARVPSGPADHAKRATTRKRRPIDSGSVDPSPTFHRRDGAAERMLKAYSPMSNKFATTIRKTITGIT